MTSTLTPEPIRGASTHGTDTGAARAIALVARREITTRVSTKSFRIINVLLLVLIVGGLIVAAQFVGKGGDDAPKIGLVAAAGSPVSEALTQAGRLTGSGVDIRPFATPEEARSQVESGDVAAALVANGPGSSTAFTAITKDGLSGSAETLIRTAVSQSGLRTAISSAGANPAAVTSAAAASSTLSVAETKVTKPDEGQRIAIAYIGVILLLIVIMQGGGMISVGVVEEKSSRIVEILLATIKPLHLLWGKILGIGTILLGQLVVLAGAGLITGSATGLLTVPTTAVSMFVAVIVWFLLGFLFFATLYAAAGSMVSRQEEAGSTTLPLTFLALGVLYAGIFGINAITSTPMTILSWIPPFSASLMPMRIATGDASVGQIIGTVVLMIAACAATTWIASRIYQRSILRTGSRVKWSEAVLGRSHDAQRTPVETA
ncbi:ABC transporter permease [Williamsia serinedens]|uniref:ABC-2 type transport system permease protein n=1 Tax=Williamsia serinedens TaxID=391736 RepID=A0ABT1H2I1_9NOCA|nr:ABC transporter permease [Williamsia serinedens]MCP2160870.1 ABC-2 type transport system permease protein [Williamsia serinedens]